ncbi:uncharacterized protein LOC107485361 [Arachis duranensis]|uniref:Uncharacterized protein LOC107485361 n=1 Tax=Arachis duranensis TaxID=130453 RepID=A0A6P4D9D9_ARADU|nr:uncharacterized protein LOC107485361 [Arachis duranensis]
MTLDNPFSEEITNFKMSKNFVLPNSLEPYKGIGDPQAHIKKFQSMMFFNGTNNEPILCRSFPTYLDGAALLWFSKLSAGSISSFEDLARYFIDYFAASRIYVHRSDYLGTIKQGQHESLKYYLTRFAEVTMDLDPKVHLHALKTGLRPGKFRETIAITKPKSLEEFRERAAGQMEIEELQEAQKVDKQPTRREEEKTFKPPSKKEQKKPFKLTPKFDTYTRFNTRRENIIKEILNAKIVKPPARAGNYQDQRFVDRSKHCTFHQKYGHTTDKCVIAKDLLEKLAIDKTSRPVAQKKRNLGTEKMKAALAETKKLLNVGFIKELRFTTWLSNVVMVWKNSGKWRMCVDFTNLNKACPKDAYPLPCIDKLVDNASGFKSLSFLDAYSGYNQILMHPEDQNKTALITEHGNFCYKVMPFGLKNAGATYQ